MVEITNDSMNGVDILDLTLPYEVIFPILKKVTETIEKESISKVDNEKYQDAIRHINTAIIMLEGEDNVIEEEQN